MFYEVLKGETAIRRTEVEGDESTIYHVTLNKGRGPSKKEPAGKAGTGKYYQLKWTFDWSGVNRQQLIDIATGAVTIDKRAEGFKREVLPEAELQAKWEDAHFIMQEELAKEGRKRLTPQERLERTGMSKAQILALLENMED